MSCPAEEALADDKGRTYGRWCVYMALRPPFLSYAVPKEVKVAVVRHRARVSMRTTVEALAWLERRGYVEVHGHNSRGTRSLTLAWALPETEQAKTEAAS